MREKTQTYSLIVALAEMQHGVVAIWQLLDLGYSKSMVHRLVCVGWLHHVHHGVYAVGRPTLDRKGHWMAAVLACGPNAFLSYYNAAALWGIRDTNQRKIDVTVPHACRANREKIRVHTTRILDPEDVTKIDNIPVTSLARTALDIAAVLRSRGPLVKAIEAADRLEVFDLRAVDRAIARSPRHRGVRRLEAVLDAYRPAPDFRSKSERRLFHELISRGFPEPCVNVIVAGCEVDFYWPQFNLVIEFDARPYHSSPRSFETDRIKDATLQRAGCAVLRVTDKRLNNDLEGVVSDARALARRNRRAA